MKVDVFSLKKQYEELKNELKEPMEKVLMSGAFILGEDVSLFEREFSAYCNVKYGIGVNSGTDALFLACLACGIGKGDEVITPAYTYIATSLGISMALAKPVFVDTEEKTYCIDVGKIEKLVTKKTKAIFTAHTLGNPINVDKIRKIADKHNLWWIEDNCDSLGSKYRNRYTGTFGDISTSSFYPPHHMTMGEGGAVLTNDSLLRRIIMSFRDWGRDCWCETGHDNTCYKRFTQKFGGLPLGYDHKYVYSHVGYNLKITDMQAAIGVAQLEKLSRFIKARRENFEYLFNVFKKYEDYLILPKAEKYSEPSWFGFPILVRGTAPFKRADIVNYLEDNKIATRMLFGGNLIKQPAYRNIKYRLSEDLKNTDLVMNNLFWIGVYPGLTGPMLHYIEKTADNFFQKEI